MHHSHPKTSYGVEALPHKGGSGYVGLYWAPGLKDGLVRDKNGGARRFDNEFEAKAAASDRLFELLNFPRARAGLRSSKYEKYGRLTGPELAVLIREAGITLTFFAFLYGTSDKRVLQWIDGVNDKGAEDLAPHPVRLILELLKADPRNVDIAEEVTKAVTTHWWDEREARRLAADESSPPSEV